MTLFINSLYNNGAFGDECGDCADRGKGREKECANGANGKRYFEKRVTIFFSNTDASDVPRAHELLDGRYQLLSSNFELFCGHTSSVHEEYYVVMYGWSCVL